MKLFKLLLILTLTISVVACADDEKSVVIPCVPMGDNYTIDSNGTFLIGSEVALIEFGKVAINNNSINAMLIDNITTSCTYNAIGNSFDSAYKGTFDGAGYTINNLTITSSSGSNQALFGYNSGTIKNLTIRNASITGGQVVGAIVGVNYGMVETSRVYNSNITAINEYAGGIVGFNDGGTVVASYVSDSTISSNTASGGIAAYNSGVVISTLGDNNTIISNNDFGGIVGNNEEGNIINNYFTNSNTISGVGTPESSDNASLIDNINALVVNDLNNDLVYFPYSFENNVNDISFELKAFPITSDGIIIDSNNTWTISNANGLATFRNNVNLGFTKINATLSDNITLDSSTSWLPIGTEYSEYVGIFNGNNRIISGLFIDNNSAYNGLFRTLGGAVINLGMKDVNINAGRYVGGITARLEAGGVIASSYVDNITISSVSSEVGGIAGSNYGSIADTNVANSTITTMDFNVGGISGYNAGNISASFVDNISVSGANGTVGGISGNNYSGTVIASYANGVTLSGDYQVGGIVGSNHYTVISTYAVIDNITANTDFGGIIGANRGVSENVRLASNYFVTDNTTLSGIGTGFNNASSVAAKNTLSELNILNYITMNDSIVINAPWLPYKYAPGVNPDSEPPILQRIIN